MSASNVEQHPPEDKGNLTANIPRKQVLELSIPKQRQGERDKDERFRSLQLPLTLGQFASLIELCEKFKCSKILQNYKIVMVEH